MQIKPGWPNSINFQREEDEPFPDSVSKQLEATRREYGDGTGRWRAAQPAWNNELSPPNRKLTPFPSPPENQAFGELLEVFRSKYPGEVYLNAQTGLPGYLYCDFADAPWQGADPHQQAETMMTEFSVVLSGRERGEVVVFGAQAINWRGVFGRARHLRYRQDVIGGSITFTFDSAQRLALITSSLFPVSDAELAMLDPGFPDQDWIEQILHGKADGMHGVPANIGFGKLHWVRDDRPFYFPFQRRDQRLGHDDHLWEYSEGGWRNARLDEKSGPDQFVGDYRPAWQAAFSDAYGREWIGFVDVVQEGLIYWDERYHSASHNYAVFDNTQEALAFENILASGDQGAIDAARQALTKSVWLGSGAITLRSATRVHLEGDRLKDTHDPADLPPVQPSDREMYLGANVMYHARRIQQYFLALLSQARIDQSLPDHVNPVQNLAIVLENAAVDDSPKYDPVTRTVHFPARSTGQHSVQEPGYDGEVIAHEITHAVMHAFCGQLFETTGIEEEQIAARALNEGLAFYWACDYFADPRWGEYAYAQWQPWRDISAIDLGFNDVVANLFNANDPAGVSYRLGMWWARVLWELRSQFSWFNVVLLRTLYGQSRLQATTQAAGASYYERIRDMFRILGSALANQLAHDSGNAAQVQANRAQVENILQGAQIA